MAGGLVGDFQHKKKAINLQARKEKLQAEIHASTLEGNDEKTEKLKRRLDGIRIEIRDHRAQGEPRAPTRGQIRKYVGQIGFFNMYEELEGDADQAKSVPVEIWLLVRELVVAIGPTGLPLYAAHVIQGALLDSACEFKPDRCACYGAPLPIVPPVRYVVMAAWVIAGVELAFHCLGLGYSAPRRLCRHLFYLQFFAFAGASALVLLLVCAWILLGILLFTVKMMPYAAAMLGLASVAALQFMRSDGFRARLDQKLWLEVERCGVFRRLFGMVQRELLRQVVERRIRAALAAVGQSAPAHLAAAARSALLLGLLYGFLFIGFDAFSDPTDPASGLLNSAILVALTLAVIQCGRATDRDEVEELVADIDRRLLAKLKGALRGMYEQARQAKRLQRELFGGGGEGPSSDSDPGSEDDD